MERIETKHNISTLGGYFVAVIIFTASGFWFLKRLITQEYFQLLELSLCLISFSITLLAIFEILGKRKFIVRDDTLIIKNIWNKAVNKIQKNEIDSYTCLTKYGKIGMHRNWLDIDLFYGKNRLRISSSDYDYESFNQLMDFFKENVSWNHTAEIKRYKNIVKKFVIFYIAFCLVAFILLYHDHQKNQPIITEADLELVEGTLYKPARIDENEDGKQSLKLQLTEHPGFTFQLKSKWFKAFESTEFINENHEGDRIGVKIVKDEYEKKISKTKRLRFIDKRINYSTIYILGLENGDQAYLNLNDINNLRQRSIPDVKLYLLLIAIVTIVGLSIYFFLRSKIPDTT